VRGVKIRGNKAKTILAKRPKKSTATCVAVDKSHKTKKYGLILLLALLSFKLQFCHILFYINTILYPFSFLFLFFFKKSLIVSGGSPTGDPSPDPPDLVKRVDPNPLISCRVRVELSGRVKIVSLN
jgi:hypothetical protein